MKVVKKTGFMGKPALLTLCHIASTFIYFTSTYTISATEELDYSAAGNPL